MFEIYTHLFIKYPRKIRDKTLPNKTILWIVLWEGNDMNEFFDKANTRNEVSSSEPVSET